MYKCGSYLTVRTYIPNICEFASFFTMMKELLEIGRKMKMVEKLGIHGKELEMLQGLLSGGASRCNRSHCPFAPPITSSLPFYT